MILAGASAKMIPVQGVHGEVLLQVMSRIRYASLILVLSVYRFATVYKCETYAGPTGFVKDHQHEDKIADHHMKTGARILTYGDFSPVSQA